MFYKNTVTPKKRGIVSSVLVSAGLVVMTLIVLVAVVACPAANSDSGGGNTPIATGEACTASGTACATGLECIANVCTVPCTADACDTDNDNDGVADADDNCPAVANPLQTNTDNPDGVTVGGDAFGDACDVDDDNDMVNDDTDIDDDNDGLIEINFLEDLDFMRHDQQGHSYKPGASATASTAGAPTAMSGTVCAAAAAPNIWLCGYELARSLNFATDADYDSGMVNMDWRPTGGDATTAANPGFVPIGNAGSQFAAIFDGNGNTITNLYVNTNERENDDGVVLFRENDDGVGLFGVLAMGGVLHDIGLADATVRSDSTNTGGLVGINAGTISASWSSGSVTSTTAANTGGLIGREVTGSTVVASYSAARVSGNSITGGLIGLSNSGIIATYATGSVTGTASNTGGLIGQFSSGLTYGGWASGSASGPRIVGGLVGSTGRSLGFQASAVSNSYWDTQASGNVFGSGDNDRDHDNNLDGDEDNELATSGRTREQMQAADGANFGGSGDAAFGGCGKAYSFRSSTEAARYPRLKRYLGTGTTAADADITGTPATDCSNHVYHATELLAGQGQ